MSVLKQQIVAIDDLEVFAKTLIPSLKSQDVISLEGDLGAGKTTFLFTLLKQMGMGDDQSFSSPTFTIHNQYEAGDFIVNHMDLYRLTSFEELESLDLIPLMAQEGHLSFVEWGNKFDEFKDLCTKVIQFEDVDGEPDSRLIIVSDTTV